MQLIALKKPMEYLEYPIGTRSSGLTKGLSVTYNSLTARLVSEVFVFGTSDTEVACKSANSFKKLSNM